MELSLPTFATIIFTFFLPFLIFILIKQLLKTTNTNTINLPPGPWKLPLIGNIHQLSNTSLPHHSLTNLSNKYGPLMQLKLGQIPIIVASSPETAKEVLKTHDVIFARRPQLLGPSIIAYNCTDIAFAPYGSYWRQLRKICNMELLSPKRVQSFRSIREEEVSYLIKTISMTVNSNSNRINLTEKIALLTNSIISRASVGKKSGDQEEFVSAMVQYLGLSSGFSVAEMFPSIKVLEKMSGLRPKLEKLHQQVDRILENIINEHKNKIGDLEEEDLVDVLLKYQEHGNLEFPLSNDNVKAIIVDMFTAGSDSSASTIEWAMAELLKNTQVMKKAQIEVRRVFNERGRVDEAGLHEIMLLKLVIKETLRLHPPVALIPRECGEHCNINGYDIPENISIFINAWAIGRDPKYWNEPERFNPERFLDSAIDYKGKDFEYLPFGSGRRICPGVSFALANIELPLAQLLYYFDWQLPGGLKPEDIDMSEANGLTISKKKNLYLIPIPYHPLCVE